MHDHQKRQGTGNGSAGCARRSVRRRGGLAVVGACYATGRDGTTAGVGPIGLNLEIAERLVVSPATARTYVS